MPMPVGCAVFTPDPTRIAVGVVFLFPDGDAGFYFVDDVAAGGKGGLTVLGSDADPDGDFTD